MIIQDDLGYIINKRKIRNMSAPESNRNNRSIASRRAFSYLSLSTINESLKSKSIKEVLEFSLFIFDAAVMDAVRLLPPNCIMLLTAI
ncbi:MAG TPA: hypothetical protein VE619_09615 [Nitrososphaeraceae archaeon]|nr:hypothetical protein [Nitrososphaeraceae archaeon]